MTGDVQKEKYVYYRCTGNRGKCELPRFREKEIAARLGEPLRRLTVSKQLAGEVISSLLRDHELQRTRLDVKLTTIRDRMDRAYTDKLDGKITEDYWERRMKSWSAEEQQISKAIERLDSEDVTERAAEAERIFNLANKAHSLYVSHDHAEKAALLKTLFSSCVIDARHVTPTFKKPYDLIASQAGLKEWSHYLWESA